MKLCMYGLILDFAPFSYVIFPVYCNCSGIRKHSGIYSDPTAIYLTLISPNLYTLIYLQKTHTIGFSF